MKKKAPLAMAKIPQKAGKHRQEKARILWNML